MSRPPLSSEELAALRRTYASLLRPGSPACPDGETLASGVLGELRDEERLPLADHVVGCRRCAEDWRLLAETHEAVSPRPPARRWVLLAAAAAAILAIAGILLVARRGPTPDEAVRGGASARSDAAVTPASGARLAAPPEELAWRSPAGATQQRARLYDSSGRLVWQGEPSPEPRARIPESVRGPLADGDYFWTVEVETDGGRSKLGPFPFSLARR